MFALPSPSDHIRAHQAISGHIRAHNSRQHTDHKTTSTDSFRGFELFPVEGRHRQVFACLFEQQQGEEKKVEIGKLFL